MFRKWFIIVVAFFVLCTSVTGSDGSFAYAHEGEASAEHAAEDLVDTSVTEIEAQTNKNKQTIQKQQGYEPGAARSSIASVTPNAKSLAALAADPAAYGQWSQVYDTSVVPVFTTLLPNGKLLMWDSVGDNKTESYTDHTFTRAMVWDPSDNTSKRVDVQGYNIFCAGFAHMTNGNILVAGGNKNASLQGIVQTHIFDWQTETWTRGKDMAAGRWYPSVITVANGEQVIIGGGPSVTEAYQLDGSIRQVTGFTNTTYGGRIYPFLVSRPDTMLQLVGPYKTMYDIGYVGKGWTMATTTRDTIDRQYGSFVTYDIGKTLVVGGGSLTEGGVKNVPTKTSVIVNTNTALGPTITTSGSMSLGRRQLNATALADGTVLVTGGMTSTAKSTLVDMTHAATTAELWQPTTGQWTMLSSASRVRQYHSTAALLPDGRVITGGGGICGDCMSAGYLEKNIEYFTPPYLYKKDGSGQLADRPAIDDAPQTIAINSTFTLASSQAASIQKVGLVALSDVTHSTDAGQRYVPLSFTSNGNTLTVQSPKTSGIAPPGYYMVFITNGSGVPSVARIVQVETAAKPLLSPVKNTGANRCIDVPNASTTIRTYLQTYTCNGTMAQDVTFNASDNSLRTMGLCLDVPNKNFKSGQKIQTYTCNGTTAQQWTLQSDGTIRPASTPTLCLATASTANKAAVSIVTCAQNTLQSWQWQ